MNTAERIEPASDRIDRAAIEEMEPRIRRWIRKTPLLAIDPADFRVEAGSLLLKLELLQHDGRATTPEQAILAHDGQGKKSRDRFTRLSSTEKAQLLAFLGSL